MYITGSNLIRWAGLSAVVAGVLFLVTIAIHPPNDGDPSSVPTSAWGIAHYASLGYSVIGALAISGIYARQVKVAGLLGLVGFLTFYVGLTVFTVFGFFEAAIMPLMVPEAPQFVENFLGMLASSTGGEGSVSGSSLGALATTFPFALALSPLGSLLFGIAILRAGILPRSAAMVFIVGTVVALLGTPLGDLVGRIGGVAAALGFAWLGYALWSEGRETASEAVPAVQS